MFLSIGLFATNSEPYPEERNIAYTVSLIKTSELESPNVHITMSLFCKKDETVKLIFPYGVGQTDMKLYKYFTNFSNHFVIIK